MTKKRSIGGLLLLAVVLAGLVIGAFKSKEVFFALTLKRITFEAHPNTRGWGYQKRWGEHAGEFHGPAVTYHISSGMKALDGVYENGWWAEGTEWNEAGEVVHQIKRGPNGGVEHKSSPVWWWGVQDELTPSSPWPPTSEDLSDKSP